MESKIIIIITFALLTDLQVKAISTKNELEHFLELDEYVLKFTWRAGCLARH